MKRKLYEVLANTIQARLNCEQSGNYDWYHRHEHRLEVLSNSLLPSGSGIDSGSHIDLDKSNGERIVINSSYHRMDEYGMYCGWIDFTVTVTASLIGDIKLNIKGRFAVDPSLKDYLYDVFDHALRYEQENDAWYTD